MSTFALGTVDRAICTTADAGASCTVSELVTSANEEIGALDNRAPMVLGSVSGTNTIDASVTPTLTAYADPQSFYLKPANDLTGAATLNINTIGAKDLVNASGSALGSGDLLATNYYIVKYVAANDHFRVLTNLGSGGFASSSGTFIMQANSGSFSAERALTAGTAITLTDGGANSTMTVGVTAGAIGATQIGTDGVSADELNATGVESELEAVLDLPQLQGEVTAANIAADAVDSSEIAANAVGNSEMADNAIGNAEMADNAIGNAEMADNAVATAELADNAVTQAEVGDDAIGINELDLVDGDTPSNGDCLSYDTGAGGTIEAITCPGAAGGDSVTVNTTAVVDPDFDSAAPAAASNGLNVIFQTASNDISAYVPNALGLKTISIPGGALIPATTAGCTAATLESTTNKIVQKICGFTSTTVDEFGWFQIAMPKGWDEGTITGQFFWTAASGSGDVVWSLACLARSDDDAIDTALGTAITVTDTLTATGDLMISSATSAVTIGGTAAEGDEIFCRVARVGTNGSDTFSGTAQLSAVKVLYSVNAMSDN